MIGINWAVKIGLQWGRDIIFTFGPLGYLDRPISVDYDLMKMSMFLRIFLHFLYFFSIFMFTIHSTAKAKGARRFASLLLMSVIAFFFSPPLDYKLPLSVMLLLYVVLSNGKLSFPYLALSVALSFLSSLAVLIKFSAAINIFFIFVLAICGLFLIRSHASVQKSLLLVTSISLTLLFTMILWHISGQNLAFLPEYIKYSIDLSNGYNDAMALAGELWHVYVALVALAVLSAAFVYAAVTRRSDLSSFFVLNLGIVFMAFKHSFTRHDLHVYNFFSVYPTIFAMLLILFINGKSTVDLKSTKLHKAILYSKSLMLIVLMTTSYAVAFPDIIRGSTDITKTIPYYIDAYNLIANATYMKELFDSNKKAVSSQYVVNPQTLSLIDNRSIDIFPWDVALVWSYDLNWSPRPIFQSYSAYTSQLDKLNSNHFEEENSPEMVLYSYNSIDGRYPLFDDPETLRTVLCNYEYLGTNGEFVILEHKSRDLVSNSTRELGAVNGKIGEVIQVPQVSDGYVFGYVDLDYSTLGRLMKIVYKPSAAYIQFKFKDGSQSPKFRLIPDIARNGILVSQYVSDASDLSQIFQGEIAENVEGVILSVDNPTHYNQDIKVRFSSFRSTR
jgi:hypothetical protein